MSDPCRVQFQIPEIAAGGIGRETVAKISVLGRGFATLGTLLRYLANTWFNLRVIADASPFITDQRTNPQVLTAGTAKEIFDSGAVYCAVHVQAESYLPAGGSTPSEMILAVDVDGKNCTFAKAKFRKYGVYPSLSIWVPANTKLFAVVSDPSGGQQTTYRVNVTKIPLRGTAAYFGEGGV